MNEAVIVKTSHLRQWFYSVPRIMDIRSRCDNNFSLITLRQSGIMTIPQGCTVELEDKIFQVSEVRRGLRSYILPPLQLVTVEGERKDSSHPVHYHNINIDNSNFDTYLGSIIIVFTAALLVVILLKWYQRKLEKTERKEVKESDYVPMHPINQTLRWNFAPPPHIYATPLFPPACLEPKAPPPSSVLPRNQKVEKLNLSPSPNLTLPENQKMETWNMSEIEYVDTKLEEYASQNDFSKD